MSSNIEIELNRQRALFDKKPVSHPNADSEHKMFISRIAWLVKKTRTMHFETYKNDYLRWLYLLIEAAIQDGRETWVADGLLLLRAAATVERTPNLQAANTIADAIEDMLKFDNRGEVQLPCTNSIPKPG